MGFPNAVIDIQGISQPTPGVEEYIVQGFIYDGGGIYDGSSFAVNDYIFDQGVFGCFRWKILEIITPPDPGMELKCLVRWADEGTHPMPDFGLSAGAACICSASPGAFGIAQCPSLSQNQAYGMSEVLYNAIQNSNDRQNDIGLLTLSGGATFKKSMQAGFAPIAAGIPVAKLQATGKIVPLDRSNDLANKPIGFTMALVANMDDLVDVLITGSNIAGILTGKGFLPGDEIYANNISGDMINTVALLDTQTDSILRLGIADCAAGIASALATDLILSISTISTPSGV